MELVSWVEGSLSIVKVNQTQEGNDLAAAAALKTLGSIPSSKTRPPPHPPPSVLQTSIRPYHWSLMFNKSSYWFQSFQQCVCGRERRRPACMCICMCVHLYDSHSSNPVPLSACMSMNNAAAGSVLHTQELTWNLPGCQVQNVFFFLLNWSQLPSGSLTGWRKVSFATDLYL